MDTLLNWVFDMALRPAKFVKLLPAKSTERQRDTTRPKMVKATNVAKKNNYNYNQSYNQYSYNKRNYNNDNSDYDLMATIAEAY